MQDGAHRLPVPLYLASRWMRIWPAMAVTAVLVWVVYDRLELQQPGSLSSTTALLGLSTRQNDIVGTIWSLDIEMQFYLLLPVVLATKTIFRRPLDLAIATALTFGLGCILYFGAGILTALLYFPMFGTGIAIYLFDLRAGFKIASSLAVLSLTFMALMNGHGYRSLPQIERDIGFMAASLLFAPFVSWNVAQRSGRIDRLLGNLSYPLYLVQEPAIQLTNHFIGAWLLWKPVAVSVCAVLTAALYATIDRPFEALRTKLIAAGNPMRKQAMGMGLGSSAP
jgi:peptidoglycan/LPS O-acetylase OafA/YrhL